MVAGLTGPPPPATLFDVPLCQPHADLFLDYVQHRLGDPPPSPRNRLFVWMQPELRLNAEPLAASSTLNWRRQIGGPSASSSRNRATHFGRAV
jgi:hypothetical protein